MENASKALIIAGAILISILLISVAIMVFNAAQKPIDQAVDSSEKQAAEMFNSAFTSYLGSDIPAAQIKQLLTKIGSTDGVEVDASGDVKKMSEVKNGKTYDVDAEYENQKIKTITIKEHT